MRLEHRSQEVLKNELLEIFGKHLDLSKYKVFFFGSRVSGKNDERSDIDVGIEGSSPIPAKVWFKIEDEIDNIHTLYSIDAVDFKKVDSQFYTLAREHIEALN